MPLLPRSLSLQFSAGSASLPASIPAQKNYTIHFEDHGQDFLEWDVDANGTVIDCRPFQAAVWVGMTKVQVDDANVVRCENTIGKALRVNYPGRISK